MANIDFAGFNLNPAALKKFGWGASLPTAFTGGLNLPASATAPAADPFLERFKKYAESAKQFERPPVDLSKVDPSERGTVALMQAFQPNLAQPYLSALMQRDAAKEAAEMQRKNYEFLSEQRRKSEQRQNLREDVRSLFNVIGRAASPIPYEMTQELAANIANISNPRNLSPQMGIQAASYSLPGRQYFA